jgi:general secretion pathway protein I
MLAFVLLATAMGLLIAMLSNGLRQVRQAQGETEASLYAQSFLDQLGVLEPIAPGRQEGGFDQDRYHYRLDISEVPDPVPAAAPGGKEAGGKGAEAAAGEAGQAAGEAGQAALESLAGPVFYRVELVVTWGAALPMQQVRLVGLRARAPPAGSVVGP